MLLFHVLLPLLASYLVALWAVRDDPNMCLMVIPDIFEAHLHQGNTFLYTPYSPSIVSTTPGLSFSLMLLHPPKLSVDDLRYPVLVDLDHFQ